MSEPVVFAALNHREFVRALATHLVHDRGLTEDLEQEVWLATLQRPPREPRAIRAWLAATLRRVVGKRHRGELRRRRRELAAAPDEAMPPTDSLVSRVELEQRVVTAVMGLREPFRTAILLRYYEELPSRAIAARLGISDVAVRARLWRGLRELRLALDQSTGGRDAWCQGFAIAFGLDVGRPSVAAAHTISLGVQSMNTLLGAAAIALCATTAVIVHHQSPAGAKPARIAGVALVVASTTQEPAATPGAAAVTREAVAGEPALEIEVGPASGPAGADELLAGTATFQVIDDATGSPVSGWTARFLSEDRFASQDGSGEAAVMLSPGTYQVSLRAPGHEDLTLPALSILADQVTALGAVRMRGGRAVVEGTVIAPHLAADAAVLVELHGNVLCPPIEAAGSLFIIDAVESVPAEEPAVRFAPGYALHCTAQMASGGRFRFEGLPAGTCYLRAIDPTTGLGAMHPVAVSIGGQTSTTLNLAAPVEATFEVSRADGTPVLPRPTGAVPFGDDAPPAADMEIVDRPADDVLSLMVSDARDALIALGEVSVATLTSEIALQEFEFAGEYLAPAVIDRARQPSDALLPPIDMPAPPTVELPVRHLGTNRYQLVLPRELLAVRAILGESEATAALDLRAGVPTTIRLVLN